MRLSLQTKILVGYVAFTLMVVGVVYLYLNTSLRQDGSDHTRQQLLHDAQLIKSYLENIDLPSLSHATIDPIVDHLGEQCGARVTVVAHDGVPRIRRPEGRLQLVGRRLPASVKVPEALAAPALATPPRPLAARPFAPWHSGSAGPTARPSHAAAPAAAAVAAAAAAGAAAAAACGTASCRLCV